MLKNHCSAVPERTEGDDEWTAQHTKWWLNCDKLFNLSCGLFFLVFIFLFVRCPLFFAPSNRAPMPHIHHSGSRRFFFFLTHSRNRLKPININLKFYLSPRASDHARLRLKYKLFNWFMTLSNRCRVNRLSNYRRSAFIVNRWNLFFFETDDFELKALLFRPSMFRAICDFNIDCAICEQFPIEFHLTSEIEKFDFLWCWMLELIERKYFDYPIIQQSVAKK